VKDQGDLTFPLDHIGLQVDFCLMTSIYPQPPVRVIEISLSTSRVRTLSLYLPYSEDKFTSSQYQRPLLGYCDDILFARIGLLSRARTH
jgi:hypothetical protein